jgi:ferredoxin
MSEQIYIKLREHLNSMPTGYPVTKSGAEIKMLKKFYTPEQAEIALVIGKVPEKAESIAGKLNMDPAEASVKIEQMASEGSLFRVNTPGGPLYIHPNFIMGLYEWHVNSIDKETAEYADDVYDALFESHWKGRETTQLRVVPVNKSIEVKNIVRSYDVLRELVKGKTGGPYAVAPCICRVEQIKKGNKITRPLETCLTFGLVAQYYIQNGIGKEINEAQLMDKLDECEEASLIPFSTNSKEIVNMCMCDKDTCQLLRIMSRYESPAREIHSAFYASINPDLCTGCGKCVKKCQISAIDQNDNQENKSGKVCSINSERCIGCGLCISCCPAAAVSLIGKEILPDVPENTVELNMRIAKERVKLGI